MGFIKCIIFASVIGFLSFLVGRILPDHWFQEDHFPYRTWKWEKGGSVYNQFLHIKKWQTKVPDMSKILPSMIRAKKVTENFQQELPAMIRETCIAEFIHFMLCIFSLPCLWLWPGPGGVLFVILYILGNLPFILIQRYNRPRLLRLKGKMLAAEKRKDG